MQPTPVDAVQHRRRFFLMINEIYRKEEKNEKGSFYNSKPCRA
jgi:hypothetical protein